LKNFKLILFVNICNKNIKNIETNNINLKIKKLEHFKFIVKFTTFLKKIKVVGGLMTSGRNHKNPYDLPQFEY